MLEFILEHWAELALALLALVDVVVSLTPTKVDDRWAGYFRLLLVSVTSTEKKKN